MFFPFQMNVLASLSAAFTTGDHRGYLTVRCCLQVVSQTVSMVDLSCYSLEVVPEYLFYSQDVTHLNLRHNFMSLQGPGGLLNLPR